MNDRFFQTLLMASTLGLSWLGMMAIHELGHMAHLWLSGGTVEYVILRPLAISYTHPGTNPHPLFVAAGGVVWGCILPLLLNLAVRVAFPSKAYLARFFAGFCLVANGAYLAGDAIFQGGDGRQLVQHGAPSWFLIAMGLPAVAVGLWLWHGLGPRFGLGSRQHRVNRRDAIALALAILLLAGLEFALSPPAASLFSLRANRSNEEGPDP